MTKFVMNRDLVHVSKLGASVEFKKGEPTFVPKMLHPEMEALGAELVEGESEESDDVNDHAKPTKKADRIAAMNEAFERIALRADKTELTANGVPHTAVLRKELGWAVDGKERDDAWAAFKHGKD